MKIRDAIRYYERFGRLPFPICGGDGTEEGEGGEEGKGSAEGEGGKTGAEGGAETKFTQKDVDRLIGERLKRDRATIRTEILAEIKQKADNQAAIDKGEFDKVLTNKDKEIADLTAAKDLLDKYEETAKLRQDQLVKDMPEAIKMLMPDDLSPLDFDKWYVKKAMPALAKLGTDEKGKGGNTNKGAPDPSKKSDVEKLIEAEIQQMRRTGMYRM